MAAIPGSVRVAGFIAPTDSTDTYPSHDAVYGKGGATQVATLAERNLITTARRTEGMLAFVAADGTYYKLKAAPWLGTDADWDVFLASNLAGDVTGPTSATVVGKLQGITVDVAGLANGDLLIYDSALVKFKPYTPALGGTVTSVALALPAIFTVSGSPVTSAGTLTAALASQAANLIFASPDGSAGTPTFRALTATDLPNIPWAKIVSTPTTLAGYGITNGALNGAVTGSGITMATARMLGRTTAGTGAIEEITVGSGLSLSAGVLSNTNAGTVTSVALSLPGIFNVTGSPVTTTGTLAATFNNQLANLVFASPDGATGAPSFRAIVSDDIASLAWSKITGTPTTVAGYGITNAALNGAVGSSGLTMNTARLLGRTTASPGAIEEIAVGSGLSLSAGVLSATGGGGTPGGATTQVQYNNAGAFAGSANLTLDPTTGTGVLTIGMTTPSTTPATGALVVAGGVGVDGAVRIGEGLQVTGFAYTDPSVLTDNVAGITPNVALADNFTLALTVVAGNTRVINNPSNLAAGMTWVVRIKQPAAGAAQAITLGSNYRTVGGAAITLSTTNDYSDLVWFWSPDGTNIYVTTATGFLV